MGLDELHNLIEHEKGQGAQEVERPDRGRGFIQWTGVGQYVQGEVVDVWEVNDERKAATIRVLEIMTSVTNTNQDGKKEVITDIGTQDLVNLSLGAADLRGRITDADIGNIVLVGFTGQKQGKKGNPMKQFTVTMRDSDGVPS